MTRTCVGCQAAAPAGELVRVVLGPDGSLAPDPRGGAFGRGAWLHPRPECLARAIPRGVARALKSEVRTSAEEFSVLLRRAGIRRLLGLVGSAFRARKAAVGATAVEEVLATGQDCLVVVATDAHAAAAGYGVSRAVALGRALAASTKVELGGALGRAEVGVVAILDRGFEAPLREAALLSELDVPRVRPRREPAFKEAL
ncbi:MAG TPA: YlxR family protein [Polyangiaceae bacterium]